MNDSLAYGTNGELYRTTDGGSHWSFIRTDSLHQQIHAVLADDSTLLAAGGFWWWQWGESGGVIRSSDGGTTWSRSGLNDTDVVSLYRAGNLILAGTQMHGVAVSDDNGRNWSKPGSDMPKDAGVWTFASLGGDIYAGTDYGVYVSHDHAQSWISLNDGLPVDSTQYFKSTVYSVGNTLFVGSSNGVHARTANSAWVNLSVGSKLDSLRVYSFTSDETYLYLGTNEGIWRRLLTEVLLDVRETNSAPLAFRLLQNYPNPFNPATRIEYSLPVQSYVRLSVYNVLGQLVANLVGNIQESGVQHVEWNAAGAPSGIYFYQLDATSLTDPSKHVSETRKAVLVK